MLHAKKVASSLPPHIAAPLHVLRQPSFEHHADSHGLCLSGREAAGSPLSRLAERGGRARSGAEQPRRLCRELPALSVCSAAAGAAPRQEQWKSR